VILERHASEALLASTGQDHERKEFRELLQLVEPSFIENFVQPKPFMVSMYIMCFSQSSQDIWQKLSDVRGFDLNQRTLGILTCISIIALSHNVMKGDMHPATIPDLSMVRSGPMREYFELIRS